MRFVHGIIDLAVVVDRPAAATTSSSTTSPSLLRGSGSEVHRDLTGFRELNQGRKRNKAMIRHQPDRRSVPPKGWKCRRVSRCPNG